jgi:hypothetical protein
LRPRQVTAGPEHGRCWLDVAWVALWLLGLVRAIARGHGGEVRVHSAAGQGSRFELMLPVTAPGSGGEPRPLRPGSALAPAAALAPAPFQAELPDGDQHGIGRSS